MSNKIQFERVGVAPSDRRRQDLLESAKRKKYLFRQAKRGRHFVDQSKTNRVPDARSNAFDRRLSTQMHFGSAEIRSRSTHGNQNAFRIRSNALSLDACRPKCISEVLKYALARRLSIQMLKNVLSLDACRSNFWKACMGSKLA